MCGYEIGDEVIIVKNECGHGFAIGSVVKITEVSDVIKGYREYKVENEGDFRFVCDCEIELKNNFDYETSNRKKLHDHIKASGYTSSELGELLGNKWHFSNITKKSRFDKFGDISEKSLSDSEFLVNSIITGLNKKSDNVETEIDSEFQFPSDKFDFKFDIPEEKSQDAFVLEDNYQFDLDTKKASGTGASQSNWIALNKIAFAICFIIVILLISILYFVVSK